MGAGASVGEIKDSVRNASRQEMEDMVASLDRKVREKLSNAIASVVSEGTDTEGTGMAKVLESGSPVPECIRLAAEALQQANFLFITTGAGMGVDSGLPDYRGAEGFWRAYPPMAKLGYDLKAMATPSQFTQSPKLAWGFYAHRYALYLRTKPHEGYYILKAWVRGVEDERGEDTSERDAGDRSKAWLHNLKGYSIFTSNVDGHFRAAGFPEDVIEEFHGCLNFLQCASPRDCAGKTEARDDDCLSEIWWAGNDMVLKVFDNEAHALTESPLRLNLDTFEAEGDLPQCIHCTRLARPNCLMFGDASWCGDRTYEQTTRRKLRFKDFVKGGCKQKNIVIIEIGAGSALPAVRNFSESFLPPGGFNYWEEFASKTTLIRINPRELEYGDEHVINIEMKALLALKAIDAELQRIQS